ncbi:MAG: hypothetical protein KAI47_00420 [Deltaproteobacteria bacterium]|nr:hypothetical protein [Deltaproteobacteria bacterium]
MAVLRELVAALVASNANGFSVSRLHGALTSQGWKVGKSTLVAYLSHVVDTFLFFLVPLRSRSARRRAVNARIDCRKVGADSRSAVVGEEKRGRDL